MLAPSGVHERGASRSASQSDQAQHFSARIQVLQERKVKLARTEPDCGSCRARASCRGGNQQSNKTWAKSKVSTTGLGENARVQTEDEGPVIL